MLKLGSLRACLPFSCLVFAAASGAFLVGSSRSSAEPEAYLLQERQSLALLMRNISMADTAPGSIVAAPSRERPNYYYHWLRDGALSLHAVLAEYESLPAGGTKQALHQLLLDHIDFNLKLQATALADGIGLGEARFTMSGDTVPGPWGSPQQDGPALRAIELTHVAELFLAEGDEALVRTKLYDGHAQTRSVIKRDLDFLVQHWRETSFDIWEELKAEHFYTRLIVWKALEAGASLATRLDDPAAAATYSATAALIAPTLEAHWQPWRGYLIEALNADTPSRIRTTGLDSATIVAVLAGYGQNDLFSVTDPRVEATVQRLEQVFRDLYPINDPERGSPGLAIGRYPEDRYDGAEVNGVGHPWPFLTAHFALYYYRLAASLKAQGSFTVTAVNHPFVAALGLNEALATGATVKAGMPAFTSLYAALIRKGDDYITRVQLSQAADGSLSEQNDRMNGQPISAPSLSMGYAAYILALRAREGN